jgi:hypothetical protein
VSSAIVAIVSAWAPARLEKQKSIREEAIRKEELRLTELAEIDRAATELLRLLSVFRGQSLQDVTYNLEDSGIATRPPRACSLLQGQFYVWESKVWSKLTSTDREVIKEMRSKIESKQIGYMVGMSRTPLRRMHPTLSNRYYR